jgi:hypothetical protein
MGVGFASIACGLLSQGPSYAAEGQAYAVADSAVDLGSDPTSARTTVATQQTQRTLRADERDQEPLPRGQAALTTGLPFFPERYLEGELAVDIRYGYKFWWLVPYLAGGFRQARLDPLNWPWEARNRKLRGWHFTVGARLEVPASRKLFPFLGIGVERAFWAYTEDAAPYCQESWYPSAWRCYRGWDWKAGYGIKPQIGLVYKPERSLGLEFWIEYVHVVDPDMFNRNIHFLSPSLGLAWHH